MFLEELAWNSLVIPVKVDINLSLIITLSKNSLLSILEACLSFTAKTFETYPCIMQKKDFWCCGLVFCGMGYGLV